ncbi:MAG: type pantothenate kinase [Cyanobacteriota bacterium erpe_2018_sw_21hr_WHONDRS-SW48-000092_B_bin.40]|jgi:type III pantothenate kinase|nr:type pantothenate kinase [Cyanobacteriota bacterium erpe_2018_sw_21hr_WHONDRS-SW48-000092_B_bin.40]
MKELLAIDIGNSNTKYGYFVDGVLQERHCYPTAEIEQRTAELICQKTFPVAVSSVVPAAEATLRRLLQNHEMTFISATEQPFLTGMAAAMGADRVADAVAAWKIHGKCRKPVVVIGLGTATTMLAISATGHVEGGFIAPGLGLTLAAMHQQTALLPLLDMKGQTLALGYDTETHMRNGVFAGHIGLIREWQAIAKQQIGKKALTIVTGGWSEAISAAHNSSKKFFDIADPNLTLKGITLLATADNSAFKHPK